MNKIEYDSIVVTCFYLVQPKPGRSHDKYKEWFKYMLKSLTSPLVIYTDDYSKSYLEDINHELIHFEIVNFTDLYFFNNYGIDFWRDQQKKDPNRYRAWQLSLLYNEKCFFIDKTIKTYNANWYIWCDIGCFREIKHFYFPNVSHLPNDKITLLQIEQFKDYEYEEGYLFHTERQMRIGGGVQVATTEVWNKWIQLYIEYFNYYTKVSTVNCDQSILAAIYMKHKDLVNLIESKTTEYTSDKWFYLLEYCGNTDLITVLIPVYNGYEFLKESIPSVINQTFKQWKLLIGINGYNDGSLEIIHIKDIVNTFDDTRITVKTYNTKNKPDTLNMMMKDCDTNWVAILDVDDLWMNNKLEEQIKYIHKYDVIGTNCKYFGTINRESGNTEKIINKQTFNIYQYNPMINSSTLIHRIDSYWTNNYNLDDYDLWIRLWKKNKTLYNIKDILTSHRIHKNSYFNSRNIQDVNGLIKYHQST